MGMSGQRHTPVAIPPGKVRYALYERVGSPQSRSGRVRKISSTPKLHGVNTLIRRKDSSTKQIA